MTSDFHTPHAFGAPLTSDEVNGPLAELDQQLVYIGTTFFNAAEYGVDSGAIASVNTAALQAAIAAANAAGGGKVLLPGGTLQFGSATQITIPGDGIHVIGCGMNVSILVWTGAGALFKNSDTSQTRYHVRFSDFEVNSNGGSTTCGGIRFENFYDSSVVRVKFNNPGATGHAVEFYGTGSTYFNTVYRCFFNLSTAGGTAVHWKDGAANPNSNRVIDSYVSGAASTTGFNMEAGGGNHIRGNEVNVGAGGVDMNIASGGFSGQDGYNFIHGNHFEGSGSVTIASNHNSLRGNTQAGTVTVTISGTDNESRPGMFRGFMKEDIAANQTDLAFGWLGPTNTAGYQNGPIAGYRCQIVGVRWYRSAAITAGNISIKVKVAGGASQTLVAMTSATAQSGVTLLATPIAVTSTSSVVVVATSDGTYAPTTLDYSIDLLLNWGDTLLG